MNTIKHVITLFTRPNCSVCEQAKQVLVNNIPHRLVAGRTLQVQEVNIDLPENSQAHAKYNYEVPVGFLGSKEVFRYWVNEDKLVKVLNDQQDDKTSTKSQYKYIRRGPGYSTIHAQRTPSLPSTSSHTPSSSSFSSTQSTIPSHYTLPTPSTFVNYSNNVDTVHSINNTTPTTPKPPKLKPPDSARSTKSSKPAPIYKTTTTKITSHTPTTISTTTRTIPSSTPIVSNARNTTPRNKTPRDATPRDKTPRRTTQREMITPDSTLEDSPHREPTSTPVSPRHITPAATPRTTTSRTTTSQTTTPRNRTRTRTEQRLVTPNFSRQHATYEDDDEILYEEQSGALSPFADPNNFRATYTGNNAFAITHTTPPSPPPPPLPQSGLLSFPLPENVIAQIPPPTPRRRDTARNRPSVSDFAIDFYEELPETTRSTTSSRNSTAPHTPRAPQTPTSHPYPTSHASHASLTSHTPLTPTTTTTSTTTTTTSSSEPTVFRDNDMTYENLLLLDSRYKHRQGLSSEQIAKFPVRIVKSSEENADSECIICLDKMNVVGSRLRVLACQHVFHDECVLKWFADQKSCPICRFWFG